MVAGATDLILEMERGVRKGIETLIDITRVPGLDRIYLDAAGLIHLGAMVTHNQCVASRLVIEQGFPLSQACWEVGAPQIRNRGTIAGNLITASPANDTIAPLMALGASVVLRSTDGERTIPLKEFYLGVRKTVMRPDELLVETVFPALRPNQRGTFIKLGLRKAQAITLVNAAVVITFKAEPQDGPQAVESTSIALGAVAPTIIFAREAMEFLTGRPLDPDVIEQAALLATNAATPIDDVRASGDYRHEMVRVCVSRALKAVATRQERAIFPENPPLLLGSGIKGAGTLAEPVVHRNNGDQPIVTRINGVERTLTGGNHKTLLRLLREEGLYTGVKEGCAEGECGACTVFLDGAAVMACMVPAPRAHGADIVTIEGIAEGEELHPVQQAFIEDGAVQCGYCTPGFIMSAVKLLEEQAHPTRETIRQALTGNLCRCTGYYKIVQAIEHASQMEVTRG